MKGVIKMNFLQKLFKIQPDFTEKYSLENIQEYSKYSISTYSDFNNGYLYVEDWLKFAVTIDGSNYLKTLEKVESASILLALSQIMQKLIELLEIVLPNFVDYSNVVRDRLTNNTLKEISNFAKDLVTKRQNLYNAIGILENILDEY